MKHENERIISGSSSQEVYISNLDGPRASTPIRDILGTDVIVHQPQYHELEKFNNEDLAEDEDYPIRGTISPLTNQRIQRSLDQTGNELSFVFGRPSSPCVDQTIDGRCLSPINEQRPLSPSSEMFAMKQDVCNMASDKGIEGRVVQGGVCCEHCNNCLIDLKRQALRIMFPDNTTRNTPLKPMNYVKVEEKLQVPDNFRRYVKRERCDVCETPIRQLKQEAVAMIQSIQQAQSASSVPANIPALVGSYNIGAHQRNHQPNRYLSRTSKSSQFSSCVSSGIPLAAQAQAYLEQNAQSWLNPVNRHNQLITNRPNQQERIYAEVKNESNMGPHGRPPLPTSASHHYHSTVVARSGSPIVISSGIPTPTGSFLSRAAQKISKKKKRHQPPDPEPPPFPTNFCDIIRSSPPPAPPCLARGLGRLLNPGAGKVKVMLKICSPIVPGQQEQGRSFLTIDPRRKQVTVHDPTASGYITSASRRSAVAAPKMFAFDGVFSPDDSLTEVCAGSLSDILQSVVSGADGCLFSYGHSRLGKSFTMIGKDHSPQTLGVIPCAIAWLFKLISDQKETTGARFSVRVSAVEVSGTQEVLRDLLTEVSGGADGGSGSNGVYLREDPICGTQLENQSELRAPTAERAAFYFDAALAATSKHVEEDGRSSHLLFTLHVYQYRIEKANRAGLPGVAGGRSRLHLIDLGSTAKSKDPNNASLSLSALGNVIMALLNGQRHLPHRDSKIAQLLRDSLGNTTCRTCIIVHVSSALPHHAETLQVVQMAARMHRMKRRKAKMSSTSSEDSSNDGSGNFRRPYRGLRMGTLREDVLYSSSHSDPDNYTSSSEQSCDTAIYLGSNGGQSLSDRDFTDNEGPPRSVPRTNPRLPRRPGGSRSSGDEGSASDSGRSMTYSDHHRFISPGLESPVARADLPIQNILQMHSAPNSPQHHPSHSSRRINPHAKPLVTRSQMPADVRDASPHTPEKSQKAHSSSSRRQKCQDGQQSVRGEQWIDGPGSAIYTEPKNVSEHWIDGPQIFKKCPQSPKPDSSSRKKLKNVVVSSEERWIDGPREMISSGSKSTNKNQAMHTLSTVNDNQVPPSPSPKLKHATTGERALKQAIIKQIPDIKMRPESSISVESNTSTHAEAATSRPVSISSNDGQMKDCIDISENMVVKPFVRDWVEKHHEVPITIVTSDSPIKPIFHESVIKKLQTSSSSSYPSPTSSPSLSKKSDSIPPDAIFPKEPETTNRVTEWVRSVSMEMPDVLDTTFSSVSMADAETNTDHDSDFEQIASKTKLNVTFDSGEPEVNIVDTSYDSVDTSDCVSARDSIYEQDVEEKLESMHLLANQLTDNETLSSKSFSNDINESAEKEIRASAKLSSLAYSQGQSPVSSDNDNSCSVLEPCRLLLLRKPDGASNPNLSKDFFSEKCIDQSVLSINSDNVETVANMSRQNITLSEKTSTSTSQTNSKDKSNNKPNIKTKPPLPHKLNGTVKPSSLPKPSYSPSSSPKQTPSTPSSKDNSPEKKQKSILHNGKTSENKTKSKSNVTVSTSTSNGVAKTNSKPKTPNGNSKLPLLSHGSTKEAKSKKKDCKVTLKVSNGQMGENSSIKQCNDSDSGNDSGIVAAVEKKLLSPYSKITKPRTPSHSSSGHGSDNSSSISTELHCHHGSKSDKINGGTSSGYESMLRESEASCSSEHDDSASESSGERKKGSKRKNGTKRSRSAPGRTSDSPPDSCKQSPAAKRKTSSPSMKNKHGKSKEEPVDIKSYTTNDIDRLQRKRPDDETSERKEQVRQLLNKQETLKQELVMAKDTIMMERSGWSFDLFVAEYADLEDPNNITALQNETAILEKRVDACKSHVMMVTCFDSKTMN
ncbi:hypothetical protein SNE40_010388 [Patella caerulea]|uniref:Kinesin motor domain-containing protein n=1 Tax=Patella caerulea TaxID=87958 RepID=A0AAN8JXV0_PATCE